MVSWPAQKTKKGEDFRKFKWRFERKPFYIVLSCIHSGTQKQQTSTSHDWHEKERSALDSSPSCMEICYSLRKHVVWMIKNILRPTNLECDKNHMESLSSGPAWPFLHPRSCLLMCVRWDYEKKHRICEKYYLKVNNIQEMEEIEGKKVRGLCGSYVSWGATNWCVFIIHNDDSKSDLRKINFKKHFSDFFIKKTIKCQYNRHNPRTNPKQTLLC